MLLQNKEGVFFLVSLCPGDDLDMDQILKPFESTTPFNHCKSQLNWFNGFLEAKRPLDGHCKLSLGLRICTSPNFWQAGQEHRGGQQKFLGAKCLATWAFGPRGWWLFRMLGWHACFDVCNPLAYFRRIKRNEEGSISIQRITPE